MSTKNTPVCSRCGYEISWDKTAREAFGTRNPLSPDKTRIHECDYDKDGNLKIKPGFEEQSKKNYEAYLAKKAAAAGTPMPVQQATQNVVQNPSTEPSPIQENQAAVGAVLNSQNLDTSIKAGFAELIRQNQQFIKDQDDRIAQMETAISQMAEFVSRIEKTVGDYVTYNPAAYSLQAIFNKLVPLVDINKLTEQTALEKLEQQKTDPTLEGENN